MERSQGQKEQISYTPTEGLALEEDAELAVLLKKWTGGPISTPVFTELARMIPQPIVEVVIFRMNNDVVETLLIPRPKDDIVWPGMVHNPGSAIRAADFKREDNNPLNGPFERIKRGEINSDFSYHPVYAGRMHRVGQRGPEVAEIYFTEIPWDNQSGHIWEAVDTLASNPKFIQDQLEHVKLAKARYLEDSEFYIEDFDIENWEVDGTIDGNLTGDVTGNIVSTDCVDATKDNQ